MSVVNHDLMTRTQIFLIESGFLGRQETRPQTDLALLPFLAIAIEGPKLRFPQTSPRLRSDHTSVSGKAAKTKEARELPIL